MRATKPVLLLSAASLCGAPLLLTRPPTTARTTQEIPLEFARIYWEYNASANDLGVHVSLDGEDWTSLAIENPDERTIFNVRGRGPYGALGMTELFFEGAEPSLDEFPLDELLALFPEGEYEFSGVTADGEPTEGSDVFTHAIPAGPRVFADVGSDGFLRIRWNAVTTTPPGFPSAPIRIAAYQVIVDPKFEVTLPASARSVTVSPEFVRFLGPGVHLFEVLAIEESGNQTLTEGSFRL